MVAAIVGTIVVGLVFATISVLLLGNTSRLLKSFGVGLLYYCSLPALAIIAGIVLALIGDTSGSYGEAVAKLLALGIGFFFLGFVGAIVRSLQLEFGSDSQNLSPVDGNEDSSAGIEIVENDEPEIQTGIPLSNPVEEANERWIATFSNLHGLTREQCLHILSVYKRNNAVILDLNEMRYDVLDPRCFQKDTVAKALGKRP